MSNAVKKYKRRLPDGQPAAFRRELPPRLRTRAQRPHREAADGALRPAGRAPGLRPRPATARSPSRCPKASITRPGSARRRKRRTRPRAATSTSAGSRLLRRPGHRLGRPPSRLRAVGHGHGVHRPGRDPQRQGEFPPDPLWNTATEYYFEAIYKNGVKMIVSNKERSGVTWEGTEGWVWADRGKHDASSKEILNSVIGANEIHLYQSDDHYRNFIDCVISRKEPIAPGGGRPPLDHDLPSRQHRDAAGSRAAAMGPEDRADHRRRRGCRDAQPTVPGSMDSPVDLSPTSARRGGGVVTWQLTD